jgi:hypothetical protein
MPLMAVNGYFRLVCGFGCGGMIETIIVIDK